MKIKELIMHYIDVYEGSEKRIILNVTNDYATEFESERDARNIVRENINWLVTNGYISVVERDQMTEMQRRYHESDGYCTIYKKIKRYNGSDI